ncbi:MULTISPECIES: hypothetical protein [Achromobacter]|uniref:hypothetical protein n=1 Tax=Achromobacter TaxID=222 RepID=UPI002FDF968E
MLSLIKNGPILIVAAAATAWPLSHYLSDDRIASLPVAFLLATIILAALLYGALARFDASLTKRISTGRLVQWLVRVNGVEVGSISDMEFAAIQRQALRDGSFLSAHATSVARAAFLLVVAISVLVPTLGLWAVFATALTVPGAVQEVIQAIWAMNDQYFVELLRMSLDVGVFGGALVLILVTLCWSHRDSSPCNHAVGTLLRRRFKVAAKGAVKVHRDWSLLPPSRIPTAP